MKLINLLEVEYGVHDLLTQHMDQIKLDSGPQTYRMLQTQLTLGKDAWVEGWLRDNGYTEHPDDWPPKDKTFDKNKKDWEEYLKNPKDIFDKDIKTKNPDISYSRLKFDLHGFTLLEANKKVSELILRCVEKKYTEILLITGKGIHSNNDQEIYVSKDLSKLRYAIPDFIETTEYLKNKVIDISIADKKDGGEGALVIKLKKL